MGVWLGNVLKDVSHQIIGDARFQASFRIAVKGIMASRAFKNVVFRLEQFFKGHFFAADITTAFCCHTDPAEIVMASDDKIDPDPEMIVEIAGPLQLPAPFHTAEKTPVNITVHSV
jgi:hypothetical protein